MALPLLALAAIQAAPAIAGFIGNLIDKKRRKGQEDKAAMGISNLADIFKTQLGGNYFDTAEASGAIREINSNAADDLRRINAMGSMGNLTDEAKIGMMGNVNRGRQAGIGQIARGADLWRQRALQNYGGALSNLFQVGMGNRQNTQNSLNNIVGGMASGIDGAMNAGVFDSLFKTKQPTPMVGGQSTGVANSLINLLGKK